MKFSREQLRRVVSVLDSQDRRFIHLVEIAGLRPERDLCGADLQRVDFGIDYYAGFNFAGADLRGANLSRARGLRPEMFICIRDDETTRWPHGLWEAITALDVEQLACNAILSGLAPPISWTPFIRQLNLSISMDQAEQLSALGADIAAGKRATTLWMTSFLQGLRTGVRERIAALVPSRYSSDRKSSLHLDASTLFGVVSAARKKALKFRRTDLIAGLWALEALDLSRTPVTDVSPLADLTNMQSLNLSNTHVADIGPLARLSRLKVLNLCHTQVCEVAPLAGLTRLETLDLTGTKITDVAALSTLTNLQTLSLRCTQVINMSTLHGLHSTRIDGP